MSSAGEIVTIFVGQAGTQLASASWELFCLEHGIRPDGFLYDGYHSCEDSHSTFFSETATGKFTPRTIIVDLEPTVVDEIRIGSYRCLFTPGSLVSGKEDASSNFAKGYYTIGEEAVDLVMDRIRNVCDSCDYLKGFIIFRSLGGGTGSGFTTLLLEHLTQEYNKKTKLDFAIYPAPHISTVIVEPYNAVLTTHAAMDYEECCFVADNEALYELCSRNLEVENPTYVNLNRLQAQVTSNITASMRFAGAVNVSLEELQTNLVPFPRIHFPLVTFAPITAPQVATNTEYSTRQITNQCFEPCNQLVKCDPRQGCYMSCCLLYRGDVNNNEVSRSLSAIKGKEFVRFVEWSPTGFKVGINYQPPTTVPGGDLARTNKTVVMLSNNTAIRHIWTRLARKYDLMYQKKAYVHHYLCEGMEESVFADAREDMKALIQDYNEVER